MNFSDDEYSDLRDLPKLLRGGRVEGAGRSDGRGSRSAVRSSWENRRASVEGECCG